MPSATGKIRLLMLNYEFPPIGGGAANANLYLLKEFASNESLRIDLLTSSPTPGLTVEQFADNITVYKVGIRKKNLHFWKKSEVISWLFKAYFQHRKLLKNNDYHIAHAFFGFPTGFLPWLTAGKLPYIISLRGSDVPGQNARLALEYKLLGPLFKSIWKKADAVIGNSKGLCDRARSFMPEMDYGMIPNAVDNSNYACGKPRSVGKPARLITVGRLSSTKQFDMLIDAVELLVRRDVDVCLTIAGGGALQESLKSRVSQKKLQGNVEIAGRIESEKMPDFYSQGDIFLSASLQEGMSNAMLEAMAASLPIIAAQCEGVEELITDNGIVLENFAAEAFADSVAALINDRDRYAAMSAAAVANAAGFSWGSVAAKYIDLYRNVINVEGTV
ncbi:MAG: glycosyltransferase family 4 protein [Planctomycetes bacterium]|nr:glycosyltransferase family 4 protein [Planctomycetota bacterium]